MIAGDRKIGHGEKRTRKWEQAISALLLQPTIEHAARSAGISAPTLRRWIREPGFQDEYRRARRDVVDQAIAHLQSAGSAAAKVLHQIIEDSGATASARVSACRTVLEMCLRSKELEEIEDRIAALEQTLKDSTPSSPNPNFS